MPFFQKQKNKLINQHYGKNEIHPEQFQPIIDPNLQALIEWVIYVSKWMPGLFGNYGKVVEMVWLVYKGYYENKTTDELFILAISCLTRSKTKRFILQKFSKSFQHVFTNPEEFGKKLQTMYLNKPKSSQLQDIQLHENQIKNYIMEQVAQKYGHKVAQKVQSKYGDNFSQIMVSAIIAMSLRDDADENKDRQLNSDPYNPEKKVKEKKYCFF